MAIKSSTFSGWELSGEHAKAFLAKIKNKKPNKFAEASLKRGKKLFREYEEKGFATLVSKKRNSK